MATKEKVKKKAKQIFEQKEVERPGSAHSQISVKEAQTTKDNTGDNGPPEKFIEDENKQEKGETSKQRDKNKASPVGTPQKSKPSPVGTPQKSKSRESTPSKKSKSESAPKKGGKKTPVMPERSPSPALSLVPSEDTRRSPSPYRKNKVDPRTGTKEMGSAVSIRSTSTVREAWTDRSETASMDGLDRASLGSKDEEIAQNAYIPYLYARKCIAKIVDDLKYMKHNHIRIVGDIQTQYKEIEDETQSQFNLFVFALRTQYSGKVQTFKQVIDIHRVDLRQKEDYWNEMLASLAERNNRLLKDKKVLLIQNKVEIERLEKERIEVQTELTQQLDKSNAALIAAQRDTGTADELKAVVVQLDAQKAEVARLQAELTASKSVSATAVTAAAVVATRDTESEQEEQKEVAKTTAPLMAAAVVSDNEKSRISNERDQMEDERQKYDDERLMMEDDRLGFENQRQEWLNEIKALQLAVAVNTKENAEWKAKYTGMKGQLEESATLHAKYKALEDQYLAMAAIVAASDSSKKLAEDNAKKTKEEKNMMIVEQDRTDTEIQQWEEDFVQKNGRPSTDDDKPDSVKELYVQKEELATMVTSLDKKLDTFEKVEKGKIPDPPEVPPVPIVVKDPEVQTIEIKVPDPAIVVQLEASYDEMRKLREQISELQQENLNQSSQISQQNEELSKQRDRITELEHEIAALKAAAVATAAAGASSAELDELKKENRGMKKDMKKLLKKLEKNKTGTDPALVGSPEQKISTLEDRVTDIESENESLLEDKSKLTSERDNLLEQMTALQLQLATAETAAHVGTSEHTVVPVAAPAPLQSSHGQECTVSGHAELVEQLQIKTEEIAEKDMKIQEQEQRISDKIQEIEKVKDEMKHMRKDMLKMAKQHSKLQLKLKDLVEFAKTKKLLAAVARYVHEIHGEVPDAANGVVTKLTLVTADVATDRMPYDQSQKAVDAWEEKYKKKNGKAPGEKDRDAEGKKVYAAMEEKKAALDDSKINMEALKIMKTGDYVAPISRQASSVQDIKEEGAMVERIEHQMSAMDNKVSELETENDDLKKERSQMAAKLMDLETKLEEAKNQAELQASLAMGTNTEELSEQITRLQAQGTSQDTVLAQEKAAHSNTKDELENLRKQMDVLREEMNNEKADIRAKLDSNNKTSKAIMKAMEQELDKSKTRIDELEKERLANVPMDTAKEIKNLQTKIAALEKEKSASGTTAVGLTGQMSELQTKLDSANKNLETQRAANRDLEAKCKNAKLEKDKSVRDAVSVQEKKDQSRMNDDKKRIAALEKRIKELESAGVKPGVVAAVGGKGGNTEAAVKAMREQVIKLKQENNELNTRIKQVELDMKRGGRPGTAAAGGLAEDKNAQKRNEKILKELEKRVEIEKNKSTKLDENLKTTEEELKVTKKERDNNVNELKKVKLELDTLGMAAKEGVEAATKVKALEKDNRKLGEENKTLTENYNSERVLRRKYYNIVEDMKGKIRVYCRARPLSGTEKGRGNVSVIKSPDEYSISVESSRGLKEFTFDQIFMEATSQEKVFEDTNNLIQSAVDGFNVCIFAYGQTGSGKTYTMIGDRDQKYPGIAPRAFERIFELGHELRSKFTITVTAYMMELYNEKLIDLFAKPGTSDDDRMEIKKDKKGMVYVQGSCVKDAHNAKELGALFDEGSKNRHTASTKMNDESSRSHLIIGIMLESTNKATGQVLKGKLSLVDLAGSERVAKTGAGAEQLKEAMSINKSLSALGDVISALSSDQQFIPYRNNKLTMLMQDSLGGNAKTLMFVNISPADYNQDETIISLMYASRVKLITNDASKNADNKEISKLKSIIAKLKKGEDVEEVE
ncbi:myosin-1B-like [Mizuhopecten yessoensis]|uniref:Kinesin-like calmodulin-binding protein-like n=1 Tax=Mizuhopecten yessoensis TaxID=6573 RepID=A0A210PRH0_MIZYE|nr:myosin-1B-like [Mizuhopecten yessoensis]OWF39036.1 Kinesin-like calmodulin-binding protein-like [Mizuhopecten yessoensis]